MFENFGFKMPGTAEALTDFDMARCGGGNKNKVLHLMERVEAVVRNSSKQPHSYGLKGN